MWCMIKSEDILKTSASESQGKTKELMSNLQYVSTLEDVLQSLIKRWCTQSQDVKEVNELPTCNLQDDINKKSLLSYNPRLQ